MEEEELSVNACKLAAIYCQNSAKNKLKLSLPGINTVK
jgi:hypothetical protein